MTQRSVLVLGSRDGGPSELTQILDRNGWDVREGVAVADARRCLGSRWSGFILTDTDLSDGTWRDIVALASAVCPEIQVVVTSPTADEALWAEALNQGAFDVIAQPLDEAEVIRVSTSAARRSQPKVIGAGSWG